MASRRVALEKIGFTVGHSSVLERSVWLLADKTFFWIFRTGFFRKLSALYWGILIVLSALSSRVVGGLDDVMGLECEITVGRLVDISGLSGGEEFLYVMEHLGLRVPSRGMP